MAILSSAVLIEECLLSYLLHFMEFITASYFHSCVGKKKKKKRRSHHLSLVSAHMTFPTIAMFLLHPMFILCSVELRLKCLNAR